MSKSRTKISDEAFERVATGLIEALERGTEAWPLPEPPMSDPDFPPIPPTSPHRLFEEGLGILNIDRGNPKRVLVVVFVGGAVLSSSSSSSSSSRIDPASRSD